MALLDLSSDLARYRSTFSKDQKNTAETSAATNNRNFATVQPITAKLEQFASRIHKPTDANKSISKSPTQDIRDFASKNLLVNSVSKYSPANRTSIHEAGLRAPLPKVITSLGDVQKKTSVSRLDKSSLVILKSSPKNDTIKSPINITPVVQSVETKSTIVISKSNSSNSSVVNPNTKLLRPDASPLNRATSPTILKETRGGVVNPNITISETQTINNIVDPKIQPITAIQSTDRSKQSIVINKNLVSPLNNVVDPKITLQPSKLIVDRSSTSPNIIKDTVKEGLVINPNVKILKMESGTFHLKDESELNLDGKPVKFVTASKLEKHTITREPSRKRYITISKLIGDDSKYNLDTVVKTIPYGRNEHPEKSKYSIKGVQAVNFFKDTNAKGFIVSAAKGSSNFKDNSSLGWSGGSQLAPSVNFIVNSNADGFTKFVSQGITLYHINSSLLGFSKPADSDHFDISKQYSTEGFKIFTTPLHTAYKVNASVFGWNGKVAPTVDYFDGTNSNTTAGFEAFAKMLDTKYKLDSSRFDWNGSPEQSPEANYFDLTNKNTTTGFHRKAQLLDTKYVPESSAYDWDGTSQTSPEVNYFDITNRNTIAGFNRLAQLYDTKYVPESSAYDWDGNRQNAPAVNYFDLTSRNTTDGFHTFAQMLATKYVPESSAYDWDGAPQAAPETDFFDIGKAYTTKGFEKFTQKLVTRYIKDASLYNWDGTTQQAPETDFFDISKTYATSGYEKFTQQLVTRYNKDASLYNWDGSQQQAPEVNYFDIQSKFTTKGFEKFSQKLVTRYITDASDYNWDGTRAQAPEVDYFGNTDQSGFKKFVVKLQSDYKKNTSAFTFKSTLPSPVDFFDNINQTGFFNKTQMLVTKFTKRGSKFGFTGTLPSPVDFFVNTASTGFTLKVQHGATKYKVGVSKFVFNGSGHNAPEANYITDTNASGFSNYMQEFQTKFKVRTSRFVFKGAGRTAPTVDYFNNDTATGFDSFAQDLKTGFKLGKSRFSWNGNRSQAPEVNFFNLPTPNNKIIAGFNKFFIDKTATKYSESASLLSFAGKSEHSKVKDVPYTKYFGFTPYERSGFLVGMNTGESTLYPLVTPTLLVDDSPDVRYMTEGIRSQRKRLTTANEAKYAPLSLGKRPWSDGGLFATLDNQIPAIKTKAPAGAFNAKYERSLRDSTNNVGYLTKWAITRHSPSPLDDEYNKYKLQKEAHNSEPAFFSQPYVVRGIQRDGSVENQRWGFGAGFDEGITRGGATVQAERILQDVVRLGKWTASVKGLLFNVKQFGLQAMNPAVDVDPNTPTSGIFGVSATLGYNPLTLLANVATARAGVHLARHGLFPFDSDFLNKYETGTINRELNNRFLSPYARKFDSLERPMISGQQTDYNRLIGLARELLPNSYKPNADISSTSASPTDGGLVNDSVFSIQNVISNGINAVKSLMGISEIARISSNFGGAQSYLGIGGTKIHRSTHPYLTLYTTAPNLSKSNTKDTRKVTSGGGGMSSITSFSQLEPQYTQAAKKDIFYANAFTYADNFKASAEFLLLKALSYHLHGATVENDFTSIPPTGIQKPDLNRLAKLNTFDFKYPNHSSRVDALDEFSAERTGIGMHAGVPTTVTDHDNPIKKYRVASYDKLAKTKAGVPSRSKKFNDFRHDLELSGSETFVTNPLAARFDSRNVEDYFGLGTHGKVGAQRNIPFMSNITYESNETGVNKDHSDDTLFKSYPTPRLKDGHEFRGDRINIIDYKKANFNITKNLVYEKGDYSNGSLPGAEDLIEFYFSSIVLSGHHNCPAEVIVFRATFDTITDNHKPTWNPIKYMGRADPLYVYQGYERSISFGFTIHIGSRDEMKATWRKINYLSSWTAPQYTKAGFVRGPLIRLNIGNLWRKMPGFLSSLSYTFDNTQGTWETAHLPEDRIISGDRGGLSNPGVLQLPKTINVSCEFTPVGMYRPEYGGVMYSLYDDTTTSPENGLIPKDANVVNYFRTYDSNSDLNEGSLNGAYLAVPNDKVVDVPTQKLGSLENLTTGTAEVELKK